MQLASYVSDSRKRRKKIRLYLFGTIGILALYFIFFGVAWFFMRAPFFRVQNIIVTGNNAVPDADVVALAQASPSDRLGFIGSVFGWKNMFAWPDELPSRNLDMIPGLAKVAVSKDYFSHTITLNVTERTPFGIWCFIPKGGIGVSAAASTSTTSIPVMTVPDTGNDRCYWFDNNGVLFEKSMSTQGNLIFVVNDYSQTSRGLNSTVLPAQFNDNFISIMDVLRQTGLGVREIDLKDLALQEVDALTANGPRLEFSLRFPADNYLLVLKNLIGQSGFSKLQYVDCRTEDRVFYK